jgi:hypothetical protein
MTTRKFGTQAAGTSSGCVNFLREQTDGKPLDLSRRGFLPGAIAGPAVALAGAASVRPAAARSTIQEALLSRTFLVRRPTITSKGHEGWPVHWRRRQVAQNRPTDEVRKGREHV